MKEALRLDVTSLIAVGSLDLCSSKWSQHTNKSIKQNNIMRIKELRQLKQAAKLDVSKCVLHKLMLLVV